MSSWESPDACAEPTSHTPCAEGIRFHSPKGRGAAAHPGFRTALGPVRRRRSTTGRTDHVPLVAVGQTPSGYLPPR